MSPAHPEAAGWDRHLLDDLATGRGRARAVSHYAALELLRDGGDGGGVRWSDPVLDALVGRVAEDPMRLDHLCGEMSAAMAARLPAATLARLMATADREGRAHLLACLGSRPVRGAESGSPGAGVPAGTSTPNDPATRAPGGPVVATDPVTARRRARPRRGGG